MERKLAGKCCKELIMEPAQPRIEIEHGMDVTFVTFVEEKILEEGQIKDIRESLEPVIEENGSKKLILNFANVKFMTSAVLGLLVRVHKRVIELDGKLQLSNLDSNLRRVFEITQLTKVFDIS
ncbi:MAG: STAS domain-containing protein [Planctomycetota bacterium]|jgi:anti-sigma B factor antagonist